ncbi:hypothetical protein P4S68_12880 [Pseudoalteromonas sp. Hal099]
MELSCQSGYFNDLISMGVSTYTVLNYNSTGSAQNNILPAGDEKGGVDDSFSKFGQYFINVKLGDNGHVKIGGQKTKGMAFKKAQVAAVPIPKYYFRGVFG